MVPLGGEQGTHLYCWQIDITASAKLLNNITGLNQKKHNHPPPPLIHTLNTLSSVWGVSVAPPPSLTGQFLFCSSFSSGGYALTLLIKAAWVIGAEAQSSIHLVLYWFPFRIYIWKSMQIADWSFVAGGQGGLFEVFQAHFLVPVLNSNGNCCISLKIQRVYTF